MSIRLPGRHARRCCPPCLTRRPRGKHQTPTCGPMPARIAGSLRRHCGWSGRVFRGGSRPTTALDIDGIPSGSHRCPDRPGCHRFEPASTTHAAPRPSRTIDLLEGSVTIARRQRERLSGRSRTHWRSSPSVAWRVIWSAHGRPMAARTRPLREEAHAVRSPFTADRIALRSSASIATCRSPEGNSGRAPLPTPRRCIQALDNTMRRASNERPARARAGPGWSPSGADPQT